MRNGEHQRLQALQRYQQDVVDAAVGDWTLHEPDSSALTSLASALPPSLAPEALVHRHNLSLDDAARLYRVLHAGSHGLHDALMRVTARAQDRKELLEAAWSGYGALLRSGFSEHAPDFVGHVLRERNAAVERSAQLAAEVQAARAACEKLEARCAQDTVLSESDSSSYTGQSGSALHELE